MALVGLAGRLLKLKKGGTNVAWLRNVSFSENSTVIDITTQTSDNDRTILPNEGMRTATVSFDGVMAPDDAVTAVEGNYESLRTELASGNLATFTLEDQVGNAWGFVGKVASLEFSGAFDAEVTFSGTIEISGAVTYTPNS